MRGKAGPHYKWPWPPPRQGQTCYKHVQAYDSIFVQDSMTKGPNSPEAKRHRGGRSPVTADEEMQERNQPSLPSMRGASGRGSGGGGDRNSAPRAAPARGITALSPEELTQGQLAMLQRQVSIVFKFPEDSPIARCLMKAVREWQAEHIIRGARARTTLLRHSSRNSLRLRSPPRTSAARTTSTSRRWC